MGDYRKRRWRWTLEQSLKRVKWDSPEAVVVSLAIIVVPAILGWFTLGSLDVALKAALSVLATVAVLFVLLALNWARAPAALDAVREAEIADLKATISSSSGDRLSMPAPYGITQSGASRMIDALRNKKMGVLITVDMGADEARNLHRQLVTVFRESGWSATEYDSVGVKPPAECGLALLKAPGVTDEQIQVVRTALYLGGLDFEERTAESDLTIPHIALTRRDPYWIPPAKWG